MLAGFLGYHSSPASPRCCTRRSCRRPNAIAAISLVGSLVVAAATTARSRTAGCARLLGFVAVTCSSTNAVGGFLITDACCACSGRRRSARGGRGGPWSCRRSRSSWRSSPRSRASSTRPGRRNGDGGIPPRARRPGGAPLLLHPVGGDVRARAEGLELPKWARAGMSLAPSDAGRGGRHALPPAHRDLPVDRARFRNRRRDRRHDGPPHPDDRGAAADRAVALAGALAACLVGSPSTSATRASSPRDADRLDFEVVVGGLTFTGSLVAAAKLQELLRGGRSPTGDRTSSV